MLEANGSFWTNCAGFDHEQFKHTDTDHRRHCQEVLRAFQEKGMKATLDGAVANQGIRYTVLLDLPFFNPVRFPVTLALCITYS